jgi:YHS domain-containing protein
MTHATPDTTAQDPVCGMDVETASAKHTSEYRGTTYYFCSRMCLKEFEDDPQRYLTRSPERQP